jgi:hypothetical protein
MPHQKPKARRLDMHPKNVYAGGDGRLVLVVQCRCCGNESEISLPLANEYPCTCGATMYVNTEVLNTVARLEAVFKAQQQREAGAN